MDFRTCTPQQWMENEENLLKQLEAQTVWDQIPSLNANKVYNLKSGSLVRFRGMIQDMHSPEYYLEKFEVINEKANTKCLRNGKYSDGTITNKDEMVNFNSEENVTSERQTYVLISIPAINNWVNGIEEGKYKLALNPSPSSSNQIKRSHDETMESDCITNNQESITSNEVEIKKTRPETNEPVAGSSQILSEEHILNFPLPNKTGIACHLKVYQTSDELKLNDIYDFVGFLSIDTLTDVSINTENEDMESKMEKQTLHPPSSLVPRIHCVKYKKLTHNNPLLSIDDERMDSNKMDHIRKDLLLVLTQLLLGDQLAAEYLILHLISEVYIRRDFMPLGKFSLNISNIPQFENSDYGCELYNFIEQFMPKSYYLPMTLENMNSLSFIPKKDYECNRLTSGILQLSSNTHVVLDETKLSPGKLNAAGIDSIKAISSAIKNQKVTYDFNYYPLEFDCDIPFLILSEGKSMINVDTHVVLRPEDICLNTFSEIVMAAKQFLHQGLLNDIRIYLTQARLTKYELSDKVEELVQSEFVNMRQMGASADDLHSLLVLARLVCISQGKNKLDEECWVTACSLEKQRKARIIR